MANLSWRQLGQSLSPPFVAVLRPWFTPMEVTVTGASFGLIGGALLAIGAWIPALIFLIGCALCDWLDGELARATEQSTPFGAIIDSVLDRVSDCAPLAGLVAYYAGQGQPVGASAAGMALLVSILIPYAKARIESMGYPSSAGMLSRAPRQTLFLLGLILGSTVTVWVMMLISLFGAIAITQRLREVHKHLSRYEPV